MPDVTEATTEVGQMILQAIQNTFHMGPDQAVAQAQAATGVSADTVAHADMGQVFDYMCGQPDLSPEVSAYLSNASTSYHNSVSQSGNSYTGGGGSSSGGYSGSNADIVQQITNNYSSEEINDNHIDILGNVDGDIDIDQDNDQIGSVDGDGNAINTGDGDQNAVTGDHSSGAQAGEGGAAQSNSGDGAIQVQGSDVDDSAIGNGNVVGEDNTVGDGNATDGGIIGDGNATEDGTVVGDHGVVLDNTGGTISDSSLGFGEGNVQGDVNNEAGAANSQGGDASGNGLDLNFGSTVNHGQGTQTTDGEHLDPVREITESGNNESDETHISTEATPEHHVEMEHEAPQHEAAPEHLAPHVDQPAEDDHSALDGADEHHAM
jgi:hypothetical protein